MQQQQQEYNSSAVSNWLLKSDIKKLEGSDDIIKAICNDAVSDNRVLPYLNADMGFCFQETEANTDDKEVNLEDSVMQLQKRILTLERNISLFMENDNKAENGKNKIF